MICFVDADWSLVARLLCLGGVHVVWPRALGRHGGSRHQRLPPSIASIASHGSEDERSRRWSRPARGPDRLPDHRLLPLKLEARDLLRLTFIGMWVVFVLTGLVLGWGTGYVIAAAGWLVLLGLTVMARR